MTSSTPEYVGTWRLFDEAVALTLEDIDGAARPVDLHWRGTLWRVIGESRHWSTWRALPVPPRGGDLQRAHGYRTDFWRFRAQAGPASPVLHFEVRRTGCDCRLVRLGATFDVPGGTAAPDGTPRNRPDPAMKNVSAHGITLAP